jgi:signal transduction histidine kinase
VTNRNLEVVLCNPSVVNLLGLPSSPPLPAPLSEYFNDGVLQEAIQGLLSGNDPDKCIYQETCKDQVHLRAMSAPFFGPDQEVLGAVTVFHDITSFKELDQMKTHFVNLVSHELRSPLSAVKLQHAVILEGLAGDLTHKQRELLTRAHDKIQGLMDLINDLLDIARIESGHKHLELLPLDLGDVLHEVVELLRAKAEAQKVSLRLELGELPLILADRRSMDEVFTNLISNAVNYSPDGGDVTIAAQCRPDYLEVRVSDQGIGIEPEEIAKIFEKFYRVKSPKTRQVIGTGLGLSLVRSIIEAHRGLVEVESRVGAGSTFKVFLPKAPRHG